MSQWDTETSPTEELNFWEPQLPRPAHKFIRGALMRTAIRNPGKAHNATGQTVLQAEGGKASRKQK